MFIVGKEGCQLSKGEMALRATLARPHRHLAVKCNVFSKLFNKIKLIPAGFLLWEVFTHLKDPMHLLLLHTDVKLLDQSVT